MKKSKVFISQFIKWLHNEHVRPMGGKKKNILLVGCMRPLLRNSFQNPWSVSGTALPLPCCLAMTLHCLALHCKGFPFQKWKYVTHIPLLLPHMR